MTPTMALPGAMTRSAGTSDRPVWALDGRDWPHRADSRFVEAAGIRWHVQRYGRGEPLLLLHGTASATHSWRQLGPRLAERYQVTAIDLPGHGFTSAPAEPSAFTQRGMARAVMGLLRRLDLAPSVVIGHSAGAALGAALCLEGGLRPRLLVSLNGALSVEHAFTAALFPGLARLASLAPVAQLFAWRATAARVDSVIRSTGSVLDPEGIELYRRLFARRGHVSAAFAWMAGWGRASVLGGLDALPCPLALVVAGDDRAVPASAAEALHRHLPRSTLERLAGGGHLAHEAAPDAVAARLFSILETISQQEAR